MEEQKRHSGFETMRILSMVMIVLMHGIGHGGLGSAAPQGSAAFWIYWLLFILARVSTNCFVMLSGYYLSERKMSVHAGRLFRIGAQVWFYSMLTFCIAVRAGAVPLSAVKLLRALLPLTSNGYWFASAYFLMYLSVPVLNAVVQSLDRRQYKTLLLVALLLLLLHKHKTGKKSFILNAMIALRRYRFLIKQLVDRDFKAKYKRSILGVFWSFLNPLLNMIVQYVVFMNMFKFDIPYFPVYLLCGNVVFNYFSEACGMALTSIVGNADLIKKVYEVSFYPNHRYIHQGNYLIIGMSPRMPLIYLKNTIYERKESNKLHAETYRQFPAGRTTRHSPCIPKYLQPD
mgnify:CR=1 FL=1